MLQTNQPISKQTQAKHNVDDNMDVVTQQLHATTVVTVRVCKCISSLATLSQVWHHFKIQSHGHAVLEVKLKTGELDFPTQRTITNYAVTSRKIWKVPKNRALGTKHIVPRLIRYTPRLWPQKSDLRPRLPLNKDVQKWSQLITTLCYRSFWFIAQKNTQHSHYYRHNPGFPRFCHL